MNNFTHGGHSSIFSPEIGYDYLTVQVCTVVLVEVFFKENVQSHSGYNGKYSVILSVLDPRKCEYLKDYLLDFEHAYITIYEHFQHLL
jgi:hypothetical protein